MLSAASAKVWVKPTRPSGETIGRNMFHMGKKEQDRHLCLSRTRRLKTFCPQSSLTRCCFNLSGYLFLGIMVPKLGSSSCAGHLLESGVPHTCNTKISSNLAGQSALCIRMLTHVRIKKKKHQRFGQRDAASTRICVALRL